MRARVRAVTPAELAWIMLPPCAIATLLAIVVLGPPLGHALFRPPTETLWPPTWWVTQGRPEPVEQGRYVLALLAPVLFAAAVVAGARRPPALSPQLIRLLMLAGQATVPALVVVALLGQHNKILVDRPLLPIPSARALLTAGALVAVALIAMRRRRVAEQVARLAQETTARRVACLAVAIAFAAAVLLEAVTTDGLAEDAGQMNWALNDAFAVLDGRTPLVDYHVLYAKLLPYPTALALATFGTTALVFTLAMAVLSVLTLIAVYAVFRRVVRSSLLALGLFVPFVALGDVGHTMGTPAMWPMRYGGAYLLAWLTVRHLDGSSPRRAWILFLVGGLVTINNQEFGMGAVLATIAALLCARPPRTARDGLRLAGDVAGGTLAAVALVSLFTLVRAGAFPDPGLLTEWPRIFTSLGWFSLPMPTAGLHLVLYTTFAGAVGAAAVRLTRPDDDALLTSMLMWSGVFGLVAGSYYVGRSDELKLLSMLSAWGFALALLTVAAVRGLAARGWRAPTIPQLLVLFGFGFAIWSISRLSQPQDQIARLTADTPTPTYRAGAERFVGERTRPGETVAITLPESFRIAHELRLRNVAPYVLQNAIVTRAQLQTLIDALRHEHVRKVFVPETKITLAGEGQTAPEQLDALAAAGFPVTATEPAGFVELSADGRSGR